LRRRDFTREDVKRIEALLSYFKLPVKCRVTGSDNGCYPER
jgi:hypothetical protein